MPAIDRKAGRYQEINATWRCIDLTIRHCAGWCAMVDMDHIEVISAAQVALPITETGYRSLFMSPERIAEYGTALDYVMAWLDHEAESASWKRCEAEARQLNLF